jgi:Tol biopolymer transport system component
VVFARQGFPRDVSAGNFAKFEDTMKIIGLVLAMMILAGISSTHAELNSRAVLGNTPILFTVRGPDRDGTHSYMRPSSFSRMGTQLKVLDPGTGKTRVLVSAPKGIIRRPCVHFDGRRIVFSMCEDSRDMFHIYEIEVNPATLFAGGGEVEPKQLTFAPDVYDVDPIYLPDGKIAFCSTRDLKIVPCAGQLVPQMFRMDGDGANIHQITRSTVHENELSLTPDGRILYSRWDYVDRNFGDGHGFWVANPDGTNQAIVYGNNTAHPASPWTSRMMPNGRIICILGTHHGSLGGAMAVLDTGETVDGRGPIVRCWPPETIRRFENPEKVMLGRTKEKKGRQSMYEIWPEKAQALLPTDHNLRLHKWNDDLNSVRPWYGTPFPLNNTQFLYVVAPDRRSPAVICLGDLDGNEVKLYAEDPGCYDPMPLSPYPRPIAIASTRDYENNDGHFYIQNVYEGTHMDGLEPGSIKYVRVVEANSKQGKAGHIWRALGHQEAAIGWSGFIAKTILGTAPVENDGSASLLVPSDRFVYFQLLDENQMMVQSMRSGTSIHSGEVRGCVGCHESRMQVPEPSRSFLAQKRPPSKLKPWLGEPRRFNYLSEIQPVLDKHCVACHDFDDEGGKKIILAGDKDFAFNASYSELQSKGWTGAIGAGPAAHLPAKSWGSHTSPLIKLLRQGHEDVKLDDESLHRLITWIDLNAPYYPTGYSARSRGAPGRNPLSDAETRRFMNLTGYSVGELGNALHYTGPVVSFDRPEKSPCLDRAKDKAARAELLAIIESGKKSLAELPRADMPGFATLHAADARRKAHQEKYNRIEQEVRAAIRSGRKIMDSPEADRVTTGL